MSKGDTAKAARVCAATRTLASLTTVIFQLGRTGKVQILLSTQSLYKLLLTVKKRTRPGNIRGNILFFRLAVRSARSVDGSINDESK